MNYFGTKLHTKDNHLYWENDEPFFYLADTLWYGLTNRCTLEEFETILKDRKEKGFTAIQLVVGIPPESEPFNENTTSTNGHFAFNKNFVINKEYFEDIKVKIELTIQYKLVPVLFGSWGNYIDEVGVAGMKQLWNYIITYFAKYPVIYCLCGEADIIKKPTQLSVLHKIINKLPIIKKFGKVLLANTKAGQINSQIQKWQEVANYLHRQNKEMHPITVHIQSEHIASDVFPDSGFLTIDSFQSGHSLSGFELMDRNFAKLQKKHRAFINLEPLYEGILNQFDSRLQTSAFFKSLFAGAAGHSYGAHGLWQMAKGDNFMSHWGESDWHKALQFKGSESIGSICREITKNSVWMNYKPEAEEVTILYGTIPKLKPLIGMSGKHILVYIPETETLDTFEVSSKITNFTVYNPITMDILAESADVSILKPLFRTKKELIIAINIV